MRPFLKIVIPVLVLVFALAIVVFLKATAPEAEKNRQTKFDVAVEVAVVRSREPEIQIPVQGQVRALWISELASEVSAQVDDVHEQFKRGGVVAKGEVLVRLDPADYKTALSAAQADLTAAQLELEQEQVRSKQAAREWRELGQSGSPSSLTLRVPQLANARALLDVAESRLDQARRNLEKTQITAPFAARIEGVTTERGSVLASGSPVARLYPLERFEISLPVPVDQLGLIDFKNHPKLTLGIDLGAGRRTWEAVLVRSAGEINARTRTMELIAEIEREKGEPNLVEDPLAPGLFLNGFVRGKSLGELLAVSRGSLVDRDHVLIVDEDSRLQRRQIKIIWSDRDYVYVDQGLEEGARVVLTTLDNSIEGMKVEVVESNESESAASLD